MSLWSFFILPSFSTFKSFTHLAFYFLPSTHFSLFIHTFFSLFYFTSSTSFTFTHLTIPYLFSSTFPLQNSLSSIYLFPILISLFFLFLFLHSHSLIHLHSLPFPLFILYLSFIPFTYPSFYLLSKFIIQSYLHLKPLSFHPFHSFHSFRSYLFPFPFSLFPLFSFILSHYPIHLVITYLTFTFTLLIFFFLHHLFS